MDPLAVAIRDTADLSLFVCVVGCYTVVGVLVHIMCPDLYLYRKTKHPQDRRMQTLVAVGFWEGDVVFDSVEEWGEVFVECAEGVVAVSDRVDHNPKRNNIFDI